MSRIELEWDEKAYSIFFDIVEILPRDTNGQYIPKEHKILLKKGYDDSTIYHESIHAVIDMFKSTHERFDDMFYAKFNCAEESFCHYVCELSENIKSMIQNGEGGSK